MPDSTADSRIKTPMSIRTLTGIFIVILIMLSGPRTSAQAYPYLHYIRGVWLIVCLLAFLLILFNSLRKAGRLQWGTDTLQVRKRTLSAREIKAICIDGPLVGILPAGKAIVPVNLCFRFTEDREQATSRLINWAEANGIQLKYKRFVKWT